MMFRLAGKLVKFSLLLVIVYLGVTLFQVFQASRRDEAAEAGAAPDGSESGDADAE